MMRLSALGRRTTEASEAKYVFSPVKRSAIVDGLAGYRG